MSPEAIDLRLREVGQLYRLGMLLKSFKWIGLPEAHTAGAEINSPKAINEPEPTNRIED